MLGYVLSYDTLQSGIQYFSSAPIKNQVGTEVLASSIVAPVYGPLLSVAPNVILHKPNFS